jgi:hypothetical protein
MYVIGRTGVGKSALLESLIRQDVERGEGLVLLDPHGDLVQRVRSAIPPHRRKDLIDFDVPNTSRVLGFNPLEPVSPSARPLAAASLVDVFRKIWADSWGPRLEHVFRNSLLTLLDQPRANMTDILRLLDDRSFRSQALTQVHDPQVRDFWRREYDSYPARFRVEVIAPIQNKVGAFLADPLVRRILSAPRSHFDLRQVMDQGKILLVNLAKGKVGEETAALLGALFVTKLGHAALSRADQPEEKRRDFFVYMDEFPTYTTIGLANLLTELRKYGVAVILAHQYLTQLELVVRDAILGNVGTIIAFRVGVADAEVLAREFAPVFSAEDLVSLPRFHTYVRLLVDGVVTQPFSAETLPPFPPPAADREP